MTLEQWKDKLLKNIKRESDLAAGCRAAGDNMQSYHNGMRNAYKDAYETLVRWFMDKERSE